MEAKVNCRDGRSSILKRGLVRTETGRLAHVETWLERRGIFENDMQVNMMYEK